MAWKTITGAGTSTATKFFGDITNKFSNMFNGTDVSDTVTINAAVIWTFQNGALKLRNPANDASYLIVPSAITLDRSLILPLLTGTDTIVVEAEAATLTNKTIDLTDNTLTGTSAELATAISDETGTGVLVFGTAPTISAPSLSYTINAQTGTSYTTVLLDAGKVITSSNAAAVTVTIPPNSSVAYPIGSSITVISIGAGLTSFAQGAGVTITSTGAVSNAPVLRVQHSSATAIKTATDTWRVVGDIS